MFMTAFKASILFTSGLSIVCVSVPIRTPDNLIFPFTAIFSLLRFIDIIIAYVYLKRGSYSAAEN